MQFQNFVIKNNFTALVAATIALQACIILLGTYFNFTMPKQSVSMPISFKAAEPKPVQKVVPEVKEILPEAAPVVERRVELATVEAPAALQAAPVVESEPAPVIEEEPTKVVVHQVKPGETLTSVWVKHGGTYAGGILAANAFKAAAIKGTIRSGEKIELQISPEGDITGMRKKLSHGRVLLLDGSSAEGYKTQVIEPKITESEKIVTGSIKRSLSASAQNVSLPYEIVDDFVDLFSSRIAFRSEVQPGDSYTVIYTEKRLEDGTLLEPGKIKAASFINSGEMMSAVLFTDSKGEDHYYNQAGKPVGNYFLRYPVRFSRISSMYSTSRMHPILKVRRPHLGVDFAAPTGTPVRSVADGSITYVGYNGGAGRMVKVKHSDKYTTAYLHLSRYAKGIRKGARVKRGQVIGAVGSTGSSTGPHLDFRFAVHGRYVNPLKMKLPQMPTKYEAIPVAYLEKALGRLKRSLHDFHVALAEVKDTKQAA